MNKVDWRSLAASLTSMTEDEVKRLLDDEMAARRRVGIVRRLHQRYTMLRTARERADLMARLGA
jgi:plasmid maintenance system killer protein